MSRQKRIQGVIGQISRIREQANLLIERELRAADIEGILPAHGSVLHFLFQQDGPVAMNEIVERAGRAKSTVTGMVRTLERHGYVTKAQSPDDGRVMLVQLTAKGQSVRPTFERISAALAEKTYGDMPEKDRWHLAELLGQILTNMRRA